MFNTMKKMLITLLCAMCVCGLNAKKVKVPAGYVDLGLPSGTLWAVQNEEGYLTFDEAVEQFGAALPTEEQFRELLKECKWSWNGSGYTFVGPNGESLIIPAAGNIADYNGRKARLNGTVEHEGDWGRYWSSSLRKGKDGTIAEPHEGLCLSFEGHNEIDDGFPLMRVSANRTNKKYSIRLIYVK